MASPPPPPRYPAPFPAPPPPADGEFLLHLLQQRAALHHNHNNSSRSEGSARLLPPDAIGEQAAWHLLDPAVAALGPCHSAPRTENHNLLLRQRYHQQQQQQQQLQLQQQLQHQQRLGWSVPASPDFDVSLPSPRPPPDIPFRPPLDRFLPSPFDPLFRPGTRQSFGNATEHFQPGLYPFSQLPAPPLAQADHRHYGRPPPPLPSFPPPAGFSNSQRASEFARPNNSLPAQSLATDIETRLRIDKLPSASAVPKPQSFPQLRPNAGDLVERPLGNHPAQCVDLYSLTRSQIERVSLSVDGLSDFDRVVSSKGCPGKDHGPIGPLKRDEETFCWNMKEGLGDSRRGAHPSSHLKDRGSSSSSEICHHGVYEVNTRRLNLSENVGSPASHVLDDAFKRNIESDMPSCASTLGFQGGGIFTMARSQRSVYQEVQDPTAATVDWEGGNALRDDHANVANNLDLEGTAYGTGTQNKMRFGRQSERHKADGSRKGVNRIGLGHWVAVTRGKSLDEETLNKVEAASSMDFQLPKTAAKSNLGLPESAFPGSSDEGTNDQKLQDDLNRRRGQGQEWRLKQPYAANYAPPQRVDSGGKANKSVKKSSQIETPLSLQQDQLGLPSGTNLDFSAPGSATEQSKQALHSLPFMGRGEKVGGPQMQTILRPSKEDGTSGVCADVGKEEDEVLILGRDGFLEIDNDKEPEEKEGIGHKPGGSLVLKDLDLGVVQDDLHRVVRPTRRILTRLHKRDVNRMDMETCTSQFLSLFQTLIPSKDEELRRKQLFSCLEELVSKNWPEARLYLFGSCANAFGVCNSDIDVCLSIESEHSSKPELVLKLAEVLEANHMQNVQALPHARVPIVKYSDQTARISCDVCVNNMLAVVNTKLLYDYAQIDDRLRQLAFMVKHWAKCRQVNETYRGTLSSYAYVLMCIHFLQQRKPAVLPCLQEMKPTYQVSVGNVECAFYDQVETLKNFGSKNMETLGELLISFFEYWAFRHDYSHCVISIRTGRFISKIEKDWTRRIGNERHLICIEDPFETSHDLGRVVDKHSIAVLRDEFQRAAKIMRHHSNPCIALFEPFVREKA